MNSDVDESLDDYQDPEIISAQKRLRPPKQSLVKKSSSKDMKEVESFSSEGKIVSGSNLTSNKRTRGRVISPVRDEASLSSVEKEEFGRCPTCGKLFRILEIIDHATNCLRENFVFCKNSQKKVETFISRSESGTYTSLNSEADDSDDNHMSRRCDLANYHGDQKKCHANTCKYLLKRSSFIKSQKVIDRKVNQSVKCPLCLKVVTQRGLKRHLVACEKKKKLPAMQKKETNVSRREQEVIIPVMITLSPDSKRQQMEHRFHNIASPETFLSDGEIPGTPVLPATSLTLSNVNLISRIQNSQDADNDERPGTSGIVTGLHNRAVHSDSQLEEENDLPRFSSSRAGSNTMSLKLWDDELQSPEVSSSNMKSNTNFEGNANPVSPSFQTDTGATRIMRDNQHGNGDGLAQKFANRGMSSDKKYPATKSTTTIVNRASGYLSQFDESKKKLLATLSEQNDEMNLTLMTLTALDQDCKERDDETWHNCTGVSMDASQENGSPQKQGMPLHPVTTFVKLIDNPQFSDAKILAGHSKEIIHLHKNILFCCCPLLLEEILGCDNDELHVEDHEKSVILPLIDYIYSRRVESLLALVPAGRYLETAQLMRKFGVSLTHCHKRMLDAALEDNNRHEIVSMQMKVADVNEESNFVYGNSSSFGQDFTDVNLLPDDAPLSPISLCPSTVCDRQLSDFDSDTSHVGMSREFSVRHVPKISSSIVNSSRASESSLDVLSDSRNCGPGLGRSRPAKSRKRNIESLDTRKSLRQMFRNKKKDGNWKNRRCPCCAEGEADADARFPRFHDNVITHGKRKISERKECHLHLKKKQCLHTRKNSCSTAKKHWSKFSKKLPVESFPSSLHSLNRVSPPKRARSKMLKSAVKLPSSSCKAELDDLPTRHTRSKSAEVIKPSGVVTDSCFQLKQTLQNQAPLSIESENKNVHDDEVNLQSSSSHNNVLPCTGEPSLHSDISDLNKLHTEDEVHLYVTERLPRFKQREYIKNRPGVANMGKSTGKNAKLAKKAISAPSKLDYTFGDNELQDPKNLIQPCFYSDEEMNDARQNGEKLNSVVLSAYAFSSPKTVWNNETAESILLSMGNETELSSVSDIFLEDSLGCHSASPVKLDFVSDCPPSTPSQLVNKNFEQFQLEQKFSPTCSVLITPVPNFKGMLTPELLLRAEDIGLKRRIGKQKIRTKLEQAFLYEHQLPSKESSSKEEKRSEDKSIDEDDLLISNVDESNFKLKLSRMSALSSSYGGMNPIYSFSLLPTDQVLGLSTAVVEAMHLDGSLLKALEKMKEKTGSIKRGSLQDQTRCWAMVTPGSSGYNAKLSTIICLPEDCVTAITTPFVACVVKYYIRFKKYQFDCLPAICDRMEDWFRATERGKDK